MKKSIFLFLLLISSAAFAQKQRVLNLPNYDRKWLHFGFTVGVDVFDAGIQLSDEFLQITGGAYEINQVYAIDNEPSMGFHLGPVSNIRLGPYTDFRALLDLSFGQKKLHYMLKDTSGNLDNPMGVHTMNIESIFLEIPLQLKYKAKRLNNIRPYVIAGVTPKWDMAARKKIKDEEQPKIRLNSFDVYWEAGVGVDFYLPYFKFSTELKYQVGIFDATRHDQTQYTRAIDKLTGRQFVLSFHFE